MMKAYSTATFLYKVKNILLGHHKDRGEKKDRSNRKHYNALLKSKLTLRVQSLLLF